VTAARKDGSVRIKLTISREEHPAMFEALASIRNPRRRTGRLKERQRSSVRFFPTVPVQALLPAAKPQGQALRPLQSH
jgi:hypothetical protein